MQINQLPTKSTVELINNSTIRRNGDEYPCYLIKWDKDNHNTHLICGLRCFRKVRDVVRFHAVAAQNLLRADSIFLAAVAIWWSPWILCSIFWLLFLQFLRLIWAPRICGKRNCNTNKLPETLCTNNCQWLQTYCSQIDTEAGKLQSHTPSPWHLNPNEVCKKLKSILVAKE